MATTPLREQIFISYAHEDLDWLDRLLRNLKSIPESGFDFWTDRDIACGDEWKTAIEQKLNTATLALLLVSDHFLASEFIRKVELPAILEAAARGGLTIFWVPLTATTVAWTPLGKYQAVCPTDRPLDVMSDPECNQVIVDICGKIREHCTQLVKSTADERERLQGQLRGVIPTTSGLEIREAMGGGDHCIVYQGKIDGRDVAIKVVNDSSLHAHAKQFQNRALELRTLAHPCFIRLLDVHTDCVPQYMVTEYVPGPSIAAWLVQEGPLPIDEVIAMLKNTTAALLEYHGRGLVYGPMYPDEIHIERPARLRLSPLSITDFVSEMENSHGRFPHDPKAATYLGPDQFHGRAPDALSDQYALGLLAFVMLQGHPPCQVSRLVDFDRKREFFRDPGGKAGAWRDRHPAFSQVLFTMLRENPAERWPSLQALLKELEGLDDAQHALAKFAHATHCENRPAFAEAFYRRYFARCPETIAYFGDLQSQYDKLNEALVFLLIFRGASVQATGTSLDHVARHHRTLNITPAHFDIFFECLLETLRDDCHADAAMVSAWQHVMAPGFAFLKQRCCPMLPPKPALTRQVEQPVCTA